MKVISVINHKGGVGKTTLTANLGAYLARLGKQVLLLDLDPQASLTNSLFTIDGGSTPFPANRTLVEWYQGFVDGVPRIPLDQFITFPKEVNSALQHTGGSVAIIPSHIRLVGTDMRLLLAAGSHGGLADHIVYRLRCALASSLAPLESYDVVLIDCPPNLNIITESAIVASQHYLVPTTPDYLSTLGIANLLHAVDETVRTFNQQVEDYAPLSLRIAPSIAGIVFAMVKYAGTQPVRDHHALMNYARTVVQSEHPGAPFFGSTFRDNAAFGKDNRKSVPVILTLKATDKVYVEMVELANAFLERIGLSRTSDQVAREAVA